MEHCERKRGLLNKSIIIFKKAFVLQGQGKATHISFKETSAKQVKLPKERIHQ